MFRKALYILPFFTMTISDAEARKKGNGSFIKAFIQDVELTDDQKIAFFDMRQDNMDRREDHPKRRLGKKAIIAYAKGDLSAKEWHAQIDQMAQDHLDMRLSKLEGLIDILETYSDDQKDQVIENLNAQKETPKKVRKQHKRGQRLNRLAKALNLDESQKDILQELKNHQKVEKKNRKDIRAEKKERLSALVEGSESIRSIKKKWKAEHKERIEAKHDHADIWIELIDSLDQEQRELLSKKLNSRKGKPNRR